MIKEALIHMEQGTGNCATASYRALLPDGVMPLPLHDEILTQNGTQLNHIAACAALRILAEKGNCPVILEMGKDELPSDHISGCCSKIEQDPGGLEYYGSLIRRCFLEKDTGKLRGHVVTVFKVDMDKKTAMIVDRAPIDESAWLYSVSFDRLNSILTSVGKGKYAGVVTLVGLSPNREEFQIPANKECFYKHVEKWKSWEQSYADGLHSTPSYLST